MEFALTDEQIECYYEQGFVPEGKDRETWRYEAFGRVIAHKAQKGLVKWMEGKFRKVTGSLVKPYRFIDEDDWQSVLRHFELEGE